jgi:hypothetical protein
MNPLRRPAGTARREAPLGEIDGSPPVEDDPSNGGGGGFPHGPDCAQRPAGLAPASHGAAAAQQGTRARGPFPTWPNSQAAAPTGLHAAGPGAPTSGLGSSVLEGPAMPTGLPDWWSNPAAAAALGPEWLASVLTAATAPASTSIGNPPAGGEAELADGVSARRREAESADGVSARRRGGRSGPHLGHGQ